MNSPRPRLALALLAVLALLPAFLRAQADSQPGLRLKPGFNLEYFSRTISWDNDLLTSKLIMPTGTLSLDLEIGRGFSIGIHAGYSLSDFSGLVFRQLPFSLDYEAGAVGGFVLGGQIQKSLFNSGFWELTAEAQYTAYLGTTTIETIDQLNQSGTFDIKSTWMRLQVGPTIIYRGFELFAPFLGAAYDRLWGTSTVNEEIQDLTGTEAKTLTGKGVIAVNFGTMYEPSPNFSLKIMGTLLPYSKGTGQGLALDFGASLRAAFLF